MAKTFDVRVPAALSADALKARLLDEPSLRAAALAGGATAVTVDVAGDTSTITRTFAVPDQARLIVKASTVELIERRVWDGRTATVEIALTDVAVTVQGSLELRDGLQSDSPASAVSGCTLHASGRIEARMGFAGQFVESFIRDHVTEALHAELAALSQ